MKLTPLFSAKMWFTPPPLSWTFWIRHWIKGINVTKEYITIFLDLTIDIDISYDPIDISYDHKLEAG